MGACYSLQLPASHCVLRDYDLLEQNLGTGDLVLLLGALALGIAAPWRAAIAAAPCVMPPLCGPY
jgi:hypothetical protein